MNDSRDPLDLFHPRIATWFREELGEPTDVQRQAWPVIAEGRHVLATAPTGSGKTLTAFLWAIDRLLQGIWEGGRVRVLYVSPLKALNADVRRNLLAPLAEIRQRWEADGELAPEVGVATRSGDTPQSERRKMLRRPPEILITTPESLNILLTSKSGRALLTGVETVILDEIHAVVDSKRGTHLATAVERLTRLSGEFQRIALSATVRPLDTVAAFVGGSEVDGAGQEALYRPRSVELVRAASEKVYEVAVRLPAEAKGASEEVSFWDLLTPELVRTVRANRSTLIFTNARRLTERLTRLLNEAADEDLAYSHHGSLSREVRTVVEERLKAGELAAIVATATLELGIDVGAIDEVALVQTPPSVASAIQRVGRSGHRVGEVSRGSIYPTYGRDFLEAAVVADSIVSGDLEPLMPVEAPLDVLAQVLLSMTVAEPWPADELFAFIRSAYPYRNLTRRQFDLVVEMLAGRYAEARVSELRPRLSFDRVGGMLKARPGSDRLLYLAGGTIPDRGYFELRLADTMARLGELDEEFVWERSIGDAFTLGTQSWRITKITHNDVLVAPARRAAGMAPFWRADQSDRGYHVSAKVGELLERADRELGKPEFAALLEERHRMEPDAAASLIDFLEEQKSAMGGLLPHRGRLVVEHVRSSGGDHGRSQTVLHTFWGGRVNRPLALALAAAWQRDHPTETIEVEQDNDCIAVSLPTGASAVDLLDWVRPDEIEELLRVSLESSGFFGARFRHNAGRALLLPGRGFRHRTPLWLSRQRSKRLLSAVSRFEDFPVVVETWRTCLSDEFELGFLKELLTRVSSGEIEVEQVHTDGPSPFVGGLVWRTTNRLMYEDDTPEGVAGTRVSTELLREITLSPALRPRVPRALIAEFEAKAQRLAPGYAPRGADELLEWIKERVLIGDEELSLLGEAIARDRSSEEEGESFEELLTAIGSRLVRIRPPGGEPGIAALEALPRLAHALEVTVEDLDPAAVLPDAPEPDLAALERIARPAAEAGEEATSTEVLMGVLADWGRFFGPFLPESARVRFGLAHEGATRAAAALAEDSRWVADELSDDATRAELCDRDNLETLLRWMRAASRPSLETRPLQDLALFLADHQGVSAPGDSIDDLKDRLEQLLGYPAPAAAWESELLPARLVPYHPAWLDALMQESDLGWLGTGQERLTFIFPADLELTAAPADEETEPAGEVERLLEEAAGGRELGELVERTGAPTSEASDELWHLAWQGRATSASFLTVRRGLASRFTAEPVTTSRRPAARRGRFDRWRAARPLGDRWRSLPRPAASRDALERDERDKERVRLLLGRYGILFRELVARELPAFAWRNLFRALRIMELSGEVHSGVFFHDIPGPQFASPEAVRALKGALGEDRVFWLSAADPASLAGVDLPKLKGTLPRRLRSSHVVYHGRRPVVLSSRNGAELELRIPPEHPRMSESLEFLRVLLTREVAAKKGIAIEIINGEPATQSPYAERLRELFGATADTKALRLFRRYGSATEAP